MAAYEASVGVTNIVPATMTLSEDKGRDSRVIIGAGMGDGHHRLVMPLLDQLRYSFPWLHGPGLLRRHERGHRHDGGL